MPTSQLADTNPKEPKMPRSKNVSGIMAAAAFAIFLAACQRGPEPTPATTDAHIGMTTPANESHPPPPVAPVAAIRAPTSPPPPSLPEGTDVTYHCQDGNQLTVTYTYVTADLRWPDGREAKLSRAASASRGGDDVYVGGKVSLQHNGGSIQLHDGATTTTCGESEATA